MEKKTVADFEKLVKEWHPTKNGNLKPSDFSYGSHKKVWWKCPVADDHEWEATIYSRVNGNGCPCCGGFKIVRSNCLLTINPELSKQWHPTKNGNLTPFAITANSGQKVWWKCPVADDHEWKAIICDRNYKQSSCPCCANIKIVESNCLLTTNPELAKQWHPTKNGNLKPIDVGIGYTKKVWWKCDVADDHEWKASPGNRKKHGCPCCAGRKSVLSNSLLTINPELAKQWHPTKNGNLKPTNVVSKCRKKVWWKCNKGHEWFSKIADRSKGAGCPICNESKGEKEIAKILASLDISFERQWKSTCKNKKRLPFDFLIHINGDLKVIEYQGRQHYKPTGFGASKTRARDLFNKLQKNDSIKRNWCHKERIKLLEIPYWEYVNIEKILKEFLMEN
jgi:hypothetical protein